MHSMGKELLAKSVEQEYAHAQCCLAGYICLVIIGIRILYLTVMYEKGIGVEVDYKAAFNWCFRAAKSGCTSIFGINVS